MCLLCVLAEPFLHMLFTNSECILLMRGLHNLGVKRVGTPASNLACTSTQVRITTMRYVDALKSLTYAFLLGQREVHQPGGALRDAALTALTSVALPGLVLVCLEARPPLQQPSLARWCMHANVQALTPVAPSGDCLCMAVVLARFHCPVTSSNTHACAGRGLAQHTSCSCVSGALANRKARWHCTRLAAVALHCHPKECNPTQACCVACWAAPN